jgi:hypothetical protein
MKITTSVAALGVAFFLSGAASASTVHTFNFASPPPVSNAASQVFTADTGLDVTVTGKTYTINSGNFVGGVEIDVENNSWGLVSHNPSSEPSDNGKSGEHSIDSRYDDEAMIFDFGKEVTLTSLHFGWAKYASIGGHFHDGGMFNLFVDGALQGSYWVTAALPENITGTVFAIGATAFKFSNSNTTRHSYLKLKKMHVTYDAPEVIPLPAAGWLLLGGLGGLAAMKRRRRAA